MKPDKLHDALNHLDDDLIESADKLRLAPRKTRIPLSRSLAVAACTVFVISAALILTKFPHFDITVGDDGMADTNSKTNEMATDDNLTDGGSTAPLNGSDILKDRLKLAGGYKTVSMRKSGSAIYSEPIDSKHFEAIDTYIEMLYDAPVVPRGEVDDLLIEATLTFSKEDDTRVDLHIYKSGYICVDAGGLDSVFLNPRASVSDNAAFDDISDFLEDISFNYEAFYSYFPTPHIEQYMFCHKIFPGNTFLYLYSDAHIWPEELINEPIRYDKTSIKVYYTDDFGKTVGTFLLHLPDDFDTSYDTIVPVYAGGGGGSGECELIYRAEYGDAKLYISFNNFTWSDSIFDFEYVGIIDETEIPQNFPTEFS